MGFLTKRCQASKSDLKFLEKDVQSMKKNTQAPSVLIYEWESCKCLGEGIFMQGRSKSSGTCMKEIFACMPNQGVSSQKFWVSCIRAFPEPCRIKQDPCQQQRSKSWSLKDIWGSCGNYMVVARGLNLGALRIFGDHVGTIWLLSHALNPQTEMV